MTLNALSLWQYVGLCTLVRWTAYLSTLLSVPEYTAQRTAVIQPNVLLYASPTYWHHPYIAKEGVPSDGGRLLSWMLSHAAIRARPL